MRRYQILTLATAITLMAACGGDPAVTATVSSSATAVSSANVTSASSSSAMPSSLAVSSSSSVVAMASSSTGVVAVTIQEAEAGLCAFAGSVEVDRLGYTGTGYIDSSNNIGARIDWRIATARSGNSKMTFRFANGSTAARSSNVVVNGQVIQTVSFPTTGAWETWQTLSVNVPLNVGNNAMALIAQDAAGLANIDALTVEGVDVSAGACDIVTPGSGVIHMIGDSTMTIYTEDRRPQAGWGEYLGNYFSSATVKNWARGGRSSRSFYYEAGLWNTIAPKLAANDYLIIQFAHNDQKSDVDYDEFGTYAFCSDGTTNGETCADVEHSYYQFLKRYVLESRAKGAIPILITPIVRNYINASGVWNLKGLHNYTTAITGETFPRGDYPAAMKAVATKYGVPLVDMTTATKQIVESYGQAAAAEQLYVAGESTHPIIFYANVIAQKASDALKALGYTGGAASSSSSSSASSSAANNTFTLQDAQSGVCRVDGDANEAKNAGFTGSGYANVDNALGTSIYWAVNIATSGRYTLAIRYANGGTLNRDGALLINGGANGNYSVALPITNAWSSWQSAELTVDLVQGNNILQLSSQTADGLANIDALTIEGTHIKAGDCSSLMNNAQAVYPVAKATAVNPDTYLRIAFDNTPTINTGYVDIYDASSNQLVDRINVQPDQETAKVGARVRRDGAALITTLVQVEGNTLIVNPHSEKLSYNKTYNVVINSGVFSGVVKGQNYTGVSGTDWQFTTKAAGPSGATVTVDDDGPADFSSLQGAFDYVMKNVGGTASAQINLKNGVYLGLLELTNKSNLRVVGESRDNTIIRARNGNGLNPGDNTRALFALSGGDLNSFENLTMHNTIPRSLGGQAEVLYYSSSGRLIMKNVALISEQDTVLVKGTGYSWFYNSLIAGNVDFIWGGPKVALFENSEIRSLGDSASASSDQGGYVLQSRSAADSLGFVFLNSKFTRGVGPAGNIPGTGKTFLGRGAGKADTFDSVAFINCQMDVHVSGQGFYTGTALNPTSSTALQGYREYGSTTLAGGSINLANRGSALILNSSQVNQYYKDRATIFAAAGMAWNPTP